ncbi:MAG: SRPBCC domain-containing protein [Bacteroidales bacterium]|nr:SRPBCC domain-containing protein [Bacteroidales bacterium]
MKSIRQKHHISAPVEEVYIAVTNPLAIELWSGYPAVMSDKAESEFEIFDGDICGKNLEFVENKLVKQQWYFGEQIEDSIVTITFEEEKNNTVVELVHENVPDDEYDEMVTGWKKYYWGAIKKYFS